MVAEIICTCCHLQQLTVECNMTGRLEGTTNFTSPDAQNEILQMLSDAVFCTVVSKVKQVYVGIIVDGTQECTGNSAVLATVQMGQ